MIYKNCKLYTDMSHFGAIVPRPNPRAFRPKEKTVFAVLEDGAVLPAEVLDQETGEIMQEGYAGADIVRLTTRHDEFSRVFDETRGEKTSEARKKMISDLEPFFEDPNEAVLFVDNKLANKKRAQIARSVRFRRKACLNRFDFFATFTYDDSKCTYEEFDRQLRIYFMNKACRDGWKVMFVPEYGKETGRYHIHAVIKMPSGDSIPGTFKRERRYSKKKHCMVTVIENTYFRDRWGQNDWQSLSEMSLDERRKTVGYIIKYLTKTDGRAFYSRGIPTFLKADIEEEDVIDFVFREGNTAVLFDDFRLYQDGVDLGPFHDDQITILGFTG